MAKAADNVITLNTTTKGSNVIDFASRHKKKTAAAPSAVGLTAAGVRDCVLSESLFALPFVTLPSEDYEDWGEFWKHTTLWNVDPTDNGHEAYSTGRQYAQDAVAAIINDGAIAHSLIQVVEAIVSDGFKRRGPSGRPCRSLSAASVGFINELCKIAVESSRVVATAMAGRGLA